jgi:hypothetical protein
MAVKNFHFLNCFSSDFWTGFSFRFLLIRKQTIKIPGSRQETRNIQNHLVLERKLSMKQSQMRQTIAKINLAKRRALDKHSPM